MPDYKDFDSVQKAWKEELDKQEMRPKRTDQSPQPTDFGMDEGVVLSDGHGGFQSRVIKGNPPPMQLLPTTNIITPAHMLRVTTDVDEIYVVYKGMEGEGEQWAECAVDRVVEYADGSIRLFSGNAVTFGFNVADVVYFRITVLEDANDDDKYETQVGQAKTD